MKGVYVLLFRITKDFYRRVGSLGRVLFEKGNYAHVGSAQSSLFPRLERHYARKKKRLHWHIDYLTTSKIVSIKRSIYSPTERREFECRLSEELTAPPYSEPVPSFGSSDCKYGCKSHLFMPKSTEKHATSSIIEIYKKIGLNPLLYQHGTQSTAISCHRTSPHRAESRLGLNFR